MPHNPPVCIGIDLGARSIGWAVVASNPSSTAPADPNPLLDAGVRIFDAGVDGNVEEGKDQPKGAARRAQRSMRRQLYRRAQRIRRTLRALQSAGLLPTAVASPPEARHAYLHDLDRRLAATMLAAGEPASIVCERAVYLLRRRCLDAPQSAEAVGRALFHLAQRRGFKSNRKDGARKDTDAGQVKDAIANLARDIQSNGARTLGEYLSHLDSHQTRIRNRWAARSMYETEFDAIWSAQSPHHPSVMTPDAKAKIHHAIFHQRKLKPSTHLIGLCELEPGKRRAPLGSLIYQRFRIVQKINDLTWRDENAVLCGPLSVDDPRRMALINHLDSDGDLSISEVKKLLGLHRRAALLLEEGAAKSLSGNRTVARLRPLLTNHWDRWTPQQRDAFVNELVSDIEQDRWEKRLIDHWQLPADLAARVADVGLQDGYASLSRRAMRKLLVEMEAGIPFATAQKKLYPHRMKGLKAMDQLPGVLTADARRWLGRINNPAVARALTELRKVVNALIRKYGKPALIRIELARDIRNTRKQRQQITRDIEQRTDLRLQYKRAITTELPNFFAAREPARSDVEKWALAEECNWTCPYTGKPITPHSLLGNHVEFDVEHIIPRTRRPDDSFTNKTLCHVDENRAKANRTPYEAYHGTPRYDDVLGRVKRFQGPAARAKLRLFQIEKIDDDFTNRDLNDTRYASRLAKDYLGLLYGGADGVDPSGTRRVYALCGGITATLRNEWGLNTVLGSDGKKNREDHRHHAIDAIAIALASPASVTLLSTAAANAAQHNRRRYAPIPLPWDGFRHDVGAIIDRIVVSHRADRSLSGALHEATNYSPPMSDPRSGRPAGALVRHVRKKLIGITKSQIENIVDTKVKTIVIDFLNGREPKAVFKEGAEFPAFNPQDPTRRRIIRRVRIFENSNPIAVGSNGAQRHVATGENDHLEVVAVTKKAGSETWNIDRVISRYEANRRLRAGQPLVTNDFGPDARLVMTIRRGDYFELDIQGARRLMRVTSIGVSWLQFQPPAFGAPTLEKANRNAWLFQSGKRFQAANPNKVSVSPTGEVTPCHD